MLSIDRHPTRRQLQTFGMLLTVFVPSAPTPAAGAVYFLTEGRVRLLDVPVSAAVACVARLGVGSQELFKNVSFEPPGHPTGRA